MTEKSKEQLENELLLEKRLIEEREKEREKSDKSYADKIVERIVFAAIAIIATGFLLFFTTNFGEKLKEFFK